MQASPYWTILTLLAFALAFALTPLTLAWIWAKCFSPQKPGPMKNATYECGLQAKGDPWVRFQADYYLYGLLFLIFDVEAVFLLPFAVSVSHLPLAACLAMAGFVLLLVEGLVWAWRKGALTWA
jgi:NADH-quinone oxidoreductase subunit A